MKSTIIISDEEDPRSPHFHPPHSHSLYSKSPNHLPSSSVSSVPTVRVLKPHDDRFFSSLQPPTPLPSGGAGGGVRESGGGGMGLKVSTNNNSGGGSSTSRIPTMFTNGNNNDNDVTVINEHPPQPIRLSSGTTGTPPRTSFLSRSGGGGGSVCYSSSIPVVDYSAVPFSSSSSSSCRSSPSPEKNDRRRMSEEPQSSRRGRVGFGGFHEDKIGVVEVCSLLSSDEAMYRLLHQGRPSDSSGFVESQNYHRLHQQFHFQRNQQEQQRDEEFMSSRCETSINRAAASLKSTSPSLRFRSRPSTLIYSGRRTDDKGGEVYYSDYNNDDVDRTTTMMSGRRKTFSNLANSNKKYLSFWIPRYQSLVPLTFDGREEILLPKMISSVLGSWGLMGKWLLDAWSLVLTQIGTDTTFKGHSDDRKFFTSGCHLLSRFLPFSFRHFWEKLTMPMTMTMRLLGVKRRCNHRLRCGKEVDVFLYRKSAERDENNITSSSSSSSSSVPTIIWSTVTAVSSPKEEVLTLPPDVREELAGISFRFLSLAFCANGSKVLLLADGSGGYYSCSPKSTSREKDRNKSPWTIEDDKGDFPCVVMITRFRMKENKKTSTSFASSWNFQSSSSSSLSPPASTTRPPPSPVLSSRRMRHSSGGGGFSTVDDSRHHFPFHSSSPSSLFPRLPPWDVSEERYDFLGMSVAATEVVVDESILLGHQNDELSRVGYHYSSIISEGGRNHLNSDLTSFSALRGETTMTAAASSTTSTSPGREIIKWTNKECLPISRGRQVVCLAFHPTLVLDKTLAVGFDTGEVEVWQQRRDIVEKKNLNSSNSNSSSSSSSHREEYGEWQVVVSERLRFKRGGEGGGLKWLRWSPLGEYLAVTGKYDLYMMERAFIFSRPVYFECLNSWKVWGAGGSVVASMTWVSRHELAALMSSGWLIFWGRSGEGEWGRRGELPLFSKTWPTCMIHMCLPVGRLFVSDGNDQLLSVFCVTRAGKGGGRGGGGWEREESKNWNVSEWGELKGEEECERRFRSRRVLFDTTMMGCRGVGKILHFAIDEDRGHRLGVIFSGSDFVWIYDCGRKRLTASSAGGEDRLHDRVSLVRKVQGPATSGGCIPMTFCFGAVMSSRDDEDILLAVRWGTLAPRAVSVGEEGRRKKYVEKKDFGNRRGRGIGINNHREEGIRKDGRESYCTTTTTTDTRDQLYVDVVPIETWIYYLEGCVRRGGGKYESKDSSSPLFFPFSSSSEAAAVATTKTPRLPNESSWASNPLLLPTAETLGGGVVMGGEGESTSPWNIPSIPPHYYYPPSSREFLGDSISSGIRVSSDSRVGAPPTSMMIRKTSPSLRYPSSWTSSPPSYTNRFAHMGGGWEGGANDKLFEKSAFVPSLFMHPSSWMTGAAAEDVGWGRIGKFRRDRGMGGTWRGGGGYSRAAPYGRIMDREGGWGGTEGTFGRERGGGGGGGRRFVTVGEVTDTMPRPRSSAYYRGGGSLSLRTPQEWNRSNQGRGFGLGGN